MAGGSEKVTFPNPDGGGLAARLDRPAAEPRAFALFAHCFTGSKDVFAASRLSQALAERGFAVLRFDLTGLGASEGEFANTNFSSNLGDVIAAADHLREQYQAPHLLIGRLPGGTAVLAAAQHVIPSPIDLPKACFLAGRCPFATDVCYRSMPPREEIAPGQSLRCYHHDRVDEVDQPSDTFAEFQASAERVLGVDVVATDTAEEPH